MRLDDFDPNINVEDQRGRGGGFGGFGGGGGGGGGLLFALLPMIGSRFGCGGIVVVLILILAGSFTGAGVVWMHEGSLWQIALGYVGGGWAGLLLGPHLLPAVREAAGAYALRHPAGRAGIELGRLGVDAVTVGAATLPLADFLDRGGAAA